MYKLVQLEAEVKGIRVELKEKNLEISRLKNELATSNEKCCKLSKEKRETEKELTLLKENRKEIQNEVEELVLANERLAQECEVKADKIKQCEEEIGKVLRELSLANDQSADLQTHCSKLQFKFSKISEDLRNTQNERDQLRSELAFSSKKEANLLDRLRQTISENRNLERKLDEVTANIEQEYQRKLAAMEEHVQVLLKQNESLHEELDRFVETDERIMKELDRKDRVERIFAYRQPRSVVKGHP